MYLDGRAWYGTDAQDLQGRTGGGLFALLDGVALARGDFFAVDRDGRGEERAVGRAMFSADPVDRAQAFGLQRLLQQGLPVPKLVGIYLGGVEDLIYSPEGEIFVYEVGGAYDRLDGVRDDRVVYYRALDVLFYAFTPSHARQESLSDQVCPDARQVSLQELRVSMKDQLRYAAIKHRVAEKLQATVRIIRISDARMSK